MRRRKIHTPASTKADTAKRRLKGPSKPIPRVAKGSLDVPVSLDWLRDFEKRLVRLERAIARIDAALRPERRPPRESARRKGTSVKRRGGLRTRTGRRDSIALPLPAGPLPGPRPVPPPPSPRSGRSTL